MPKLLQINDETRIEIKKVKAYALAHLYDEQWRAEILAGIRETVGDDPNYVMHIHQGYRAVYSVDVDNGHKYHHLSISHEKGYPGVLEAEMIMELFGMGKNIKDLDNVYMEELTTAVNLIKEII